MRTLLSLLFVVSFSLSSAFAQTLTWSDPPVDLSVAGAAVSGLGRVGISADGSRATVVWVEKGSNGRRQLWSRSATIAAGTPTWGASVLVSNPQQQVDDSVVLKLSADGTRATVIWRRVDDAKRTAFLQSASASISGNSVTWGGVTELKLDLINVGSPALALSADGSRALVGTQGLEALPNSVSRGRVVLTVGRINGTSATWGAAKKISDERYKATNPSVAISADGSKGVATWSIEKSGDVIVQATTGIVGATSATWGSATDLSAIGFSSSESKVALSADGTRATVWWLRSVRPRGSILRTRSARINGLDSVWGGTSILSDVSQAAGLFSPELSSDGTRAVALWLQRSGPKLNVFSSAATISGENATWGSRVQVNPTGGVITAPSLRISADGLRALAVWSRLSGSNLLLDTASAAISGNTPTWGTIFDLGDPTRSSQLPSAALSGDAETALVVWGQPVSGANSTIRSSVGAIIHPTPTPTPIATNTPTPTPTAAPTATPVGTQSSLAPVPVHSSTDGRVVLRLRDYPNNFSRDYFGYLLRASDHKLVAFGKFTVRNQAGRLVLHVPPGRYVAFTVVRRSKAPTVVTSKYRRITVK